MPRKSKRELARAVEDLQEDHPVDIDVTTEFVEVMEREEAEAAGREILGEATEGYVAGEGPPARTPEGVDLVEVAPE